MDDHTHILPTVLVVDSDADMRQRNCGYLRAWGFHVLEAGGLSETLASLLERPDVGILFSRVSLPGDANGFEVAYRARLQHPQIKIVLATSDAMAAHKTRLICDEYLWRGRR